MKKKLVDMNSNELAKEIKSLKAGPMTKDLDVEAIESILNNIGTDKDLVAKRYDLIAKAFVYLME